VRKGSSDAARPIGSSRRLARSRAGRRGRARRSATQLRARVGRRAQAPQRRGGARGFVGIAFRVQPDLKTYDAFYLRPTNGRADDQERRNHATQYISHPDWPWDRLRKETPSRYESYADIVPGAWTKVRIEVRGDKARLFVNGAEQPTLIVNDVKSGPGAKGAVALWLGPGTIAHFRSVAVTAEPDTR
jgi:hypothetical protein